MSDSTKKRKERVNGLQTQWCPVFQSVLHLGAPQGWGWVCSELSVLLPDVSCCLDEGKEVIQP